MSLYLKNSLNLTLKELIRLVFALGSRSRHLLPGIQKAFCSTQDEAEEFRNHQFFCVISRNIDLGVNSFLRFSGQSPLFIWYVVISLSYFIRLRKSSQSHTQPPLCLAHSISLRALFCSLCSDSSFVFDRHPQMTLQYLKWLSINAR